MEVFPTCSFFHRSFDTASRTSTATRPGSPKPPSPRSRRDLPPPSCPADIYASAAAAGEPSGGASAGAVGVAVVGCGLVLRPWKVAEGFGSGGIRLGGVGDAWGSGCGRLRRDVGGDLNVRFLLF